MGNDVAVARMRRRGGFERRRVLSSSNSFAQRLEARRIDEAALDEDDQGRRKRLVAVPLDDGPGL